MFLELGAGVRSRLFSGGSGINGPILDGSASLVGSVRGGSSSVGRGSSRGVSRAIYGRCGSITGMFFGALIVGVFEMGLRLVGTDPQWTFFLIGVLIISAVAIDQWIRKVSG